MKDAHGWGSAVGIQGLGALATFGSGMLVAALQGPAAQGRYGVIRASADLLLALALFGLPQGVVHLINHRQASPAALYALVVRHAAAVLGLGWLAVGLVFIAGAGDRAWHGLPSWIDGGWPALALLLAVAGWVLHGLQRVFVLQAGTALRFSWLTVVPALSLLAATATVVALGSQHYEWALALSGAVSAAVGSLWMRPLRADAAWRAGTAPGWRPLMASSLHAMTHTVAMALQPFLALYLLQRVGASPEMLGWFVLALYLHQAFALPAGFIGPLIVKRVGQGAGSGHPAHHAPLAAAIRRAGVASALAAAAVAPLLPWLVPAVLGEAYRPSVPACIAMTLAGAVVFIGRLATAVLLGAGRLPLVSALMLARVLLVGVCMMIAFLLPALLPATAAAVAWLVAEVAATALTVRALRRAAPMVWEH